jgi:signal transduction histidine kinase
VNQRALVFPDKTGVVDALSNDERAALQSLPARVALPLMVDDELEAFCILCGPAAVAPLRGITLEYARRLRKQRLSAIASTRQALAERSNRLSLAGEAAAEIAHEIRNPLAAVRSMVQLVEEKLVTGNEADELLHQAVQEIDRATQTITTLLRLTRPSDREQLVDLSSLVTESIDFCRAGARQRGITLAPRVVDGAMVKGDSTALRGVCVNLIVNACQASPAGSTVSVKLERTAGPDGPSLQLSVSDRGHGMTEETKARALEPFFSTKQDGGGLGLAIASQTIERHGGNLQISSSLGVGTVVTVSLPQNEEERGPHPGR